MDWNRLVNSWRNVVSDQRAIWTSPWREARSSAIVWLVCTPATGVLILLDTRITRRLPATREEVAISRGHRVSGRFTQPALRRAQYWWLGGYAMTSTPSALGV